MRQIRSAQRGVVLFFALIALVVMTLGVLAVVRAVDTNGLIAGGVAFKQVATTAGEYGIDDAVAYIAANNAALNTTIKANGYYACIGATATGVMTATAGCANYFDTAVAANWVAGAVGTVAADRLTGTGLVVQYVIERMCSDETAAGLSNCMLASNKTGGASDGDAQSVLGTQTCGGQPCSTAIAPLYRVTARVTGPQNAVSLVQVYVH
jgi:Tfp pilus assembly protein PilX